MMPKTVTIVTTLVSVLLVIIFLSFVKKGFEKMGDSLTGKPAAARTNVNWQLEK